MSCSLETTALISGYGDVRMLHGLDFKAKSGKITALIGSNGAGKSTLLRAFAGLLPTQMGGIQFDGHEIGQTSSHRRVEQGLVLVPEGRLIFPDMTVEENLIVGSINRRARNAAEETIKKVYDLFPRLVERRSQHGGSLSGGEQQMLALGRGLMALPKVLLLDEPTLGLAPGMAKQIFQIVPELVAMGTTVVIAEQDVYRTLGIADDAYVLENGRLTMNDTGKNLMNQPEVMVAYLGS